MTASGGTLKYSHGNFTIADQLSLGDKVTYLKGEGEHITKRTLANGVNNDAILVGAGTTADVKLGGISDMSLVGNSGNQTAGSAIKIVSGNKFRIERLDISGFKEWAVEVAPTSGAIRVDYLTISHCWMQSNLTGAITVSSGANAGIIDHTRIADNGTGDAQVGAITIDGTNDWVLDHNILWNNTRANILISGNAGIIVINGNDLNGAYYENLIVTRCVGVTATGNHFNTASYQGAGLAPHILYGGVGVEASELVIVSNYFTDDLGQFTYWIQGTGNGGTGEMSHNRFRGVPATGLFSVDTASFMFHSNSGSGTAFRSENHGLASNVTLDGSGVGVIAHGCGALTPTYANVICTSDNLNVKVTSIDATNINILVKDLDGAVVTADTHDFYWEAKY